MRPEATRQSLPARFQENQAGSHSHPMLSVQNVWRCVGVGRRACAAACAVVQHCRCPRTVNIEKDFPGETEGGKGVCGEREGSEQTLPEHHHLVILFGLFGSFSVLCVWSGKRTAGIFPT